MSNNKAVILLSGGMDSVTLLHHIFKHPSYRKDEVLALFIDYGQKFVEEEFKKADQAVWGLRFQGYKVKIKRITMKDTMILDSVEVPMRNLAFITRASQEALIFGAEEVYVGIIDSESDNPYVDTSVEFLKKAKEMLDMFGIYLLVPFIGFNKWGVGYMAMNYKLQLTDFWSCNTPVEHECGHLEPCGECGNCKFYEEYGKFRENDNLNSLWSKANYNLSDKFKDYYVLEKVTEARLLINSSCNIACKHCYYGFKNGKTCAPELKIEEWYKIIDDLVEFGVENFHFSGKEPLLNNRIFKLTDYIKANHPHMTYEVVTNGKTVEKFKDQIVDAGFQRVILSFESFDEDFIRENYALQAFKTLKGLVPLSCFIDLTQHSLHGLEDNIVRLYEELGIRQFWIRPVYYYGGAETIAEVLLTPEEALDTYYLVKGLAEEFIDAEFTYHLKDSYIESMIPLDQDDEFTFDFQYVTNTGIPHIHYNFKFVAQMFCTKYSSQITIQSDGYMLGCGVEVCHSNYDDKSSGNVRDKDILTLVRDGKLRTLELIEGTLSCRDTNGCNTCAGGCTSKNYCYTYQSAEMNPFGEQDHLPSK